MNSVFQGKIRKIKSKSSKLLKVFSPSVFLIFPKLGRKTNAEFTMSYLCKFNSTNTLLLKLNYLKKADTAKKKKKSKLNYALVNQTVI